MVTADPAVQQQLLSVQKLDTRLDQIEHRRVGLPESARAAELGKRADGLRDDVVLLQTKVSDLDRQVSRAENDVQAVRSRSERDRRRLESGQGSAKDMVGLQHELESLARRQADLEDTELEVMEARETEAALLVTATTQHEAVLAELAQVQARRDELLAELEAERVSVQAGRDRLVADVPAPLLAIYERLRGRLGTAATVVSEGRCEGCRMALPPSDLDAVRSAPPEQVVRCPECERILVRTGSGS